MQFIRQRLLRLSPVPEDLDSVVRIDARKEVDPASVGLRQADIDGIWDEVIRLYRTGVHPAITISLRRRGKIVMARSIGHARGDGPHDGPDSVPVVAQPETPMCLFSASKAVTAFLMHMLAEDGLVELARPVTFYAPEFGRRGKKKRLFRKSCG